MRWHRMEPNTRRRVGSEKGGSAPKRCRHSTICFSAECVCAVAAWRFDNPHRKWILGAGFLGAPPISLMGTPGKMHTMFFSCFGSKCTQPLALEGFPLVATHRPVTDAVAACRAAKRGVLSTRDQRWNRNPRSQPHKFSKLVFLMKFSSSLICLNCLSGALVGVRGSDFMGILESSIGRRLVAWATRAGWANVRSVLKSQIRNISNQGFQIPYPNTQNCVKPQWFHHCSRWLNTVGSLIDTFWLNKHYQGPQIAGICVNRRGVRSHRIRVQATFGLDPPFRIPLCGTVNLLGISCQKVIIQGPKSVWWCSYPL